MIVTGMWTTTKHLGGNMKLKQALVIGVSSLFLFAVGCNDDSGFFGGNSQESSPSSVVESSEESAQVSNEESSVLSESIEESSESIQESSEITEGGSTGTVSVNLDTPKEFSNYSYKVSSDWTRLVEDTEATNKAVYDSYVEQGVQNDVQYLVDMYQLHGDHTSQDYNEVYYISIEYSDAKKGEFTLESLIESIAPNFVEDRSDAMPIEVNGKQFYYIQGSIPGVGDQSLLAIGTDGDNSYAGFVMFFNTGFNTPDEAVNFFNQVINEVHFK